MGRCFYANKRTGVNKPVVSLLFSPPPYASDIVSTLSSWTFVTQICPFPVKVIPPIVPTFEASRITQVIKREVGLQHRFLHEVLRRLWLGYEVQGNGESQCMVPFQSLLFPFMNSHLTMATARRPASVFRHVKCY